MCGRAQPAATSAAPAIIIMLLVVIDATVGLDEPGDALGIEFVHRVDPGPRRQGDLGANRRIRREQHLPVVLPDDVPELRDEVRAVTVVLYDHAAVLEVV